MQDDPSNDYDYTSAGFDGFLSRSIDSRPSLTLDALPPSQTRQLNYEQSQVTGALGDIFRIGRIEINGVEGRISAYDENGLETLRIES